MIDQLIIKGNKIKRFSFLLTGFLTLSLFCRAQAKNASDTVPFLTLQQCIDYALQNQPTIKQAQINISIAKATNAINLAGWLPQVGLTGTLLHYNSLPTTFIPDTTVAGAPPVKEKTGVANTFIPELSLSQAIYSPALAYAYKTAPLYVKQAQQLADSTRIYITASVSQAFYNLLLTLQQIDVLKQDTVSLERNYIDSYHQYIGGIVDQTDYKEAAITLNNTKAQLQQAIQNVYPQYAILKQLMGFPQKTQFNVSFDTAKMMDEIAFDTTQELKYEQRIEYQELQTSKKLQQQLTNYYHRAWLPTLSAFLYYYPEFESSAFANLFSGIYPYSTVGLSVTMPIFTGFARVKNVEKSKLQERLLDLDQDNLESQIYTEYSTAMANYKGNLVNFYFLKDNIKMATDVYNVVSLQYRQGTVAYLNVITAESNLITSQIGYLNALFQLLSSKVDLEKAMGIIP